MTNYELTQAQLKDAAMLLRLAVRKLKKGDGSAQCFADKIADWLKRNGLQGSILRTTLLTLVLSFSGCVHVRQATTDFNRRQYEKCVAKHGGETWYSERLGMRFTCRQLTYPSTICDAWSGCVGNGEQVVP